MGWSLVRFNEVKTQRSVAILVDRLGGHVYYDYQLLNDGSIADDNGRDSRPSWLASIVGRDWCHDIFYVSLAQFEGHREDGAVAVHRAEIDDSAIAKIANLPRLRWLALNGAAVTDQGITTLAERHKLERIWLSQTNISDRSLAVLQQCEALTHLSIEGTPITDLGLRFVAGLRKLRFLSLGSPYLTPNGLQQLGQIPHLEELYCDRSPVDSSVMGSIGKMHGLRVLSLRQTRANDEGMMYLAQLPKLEKLHLDGTAITDKGLSNASHWPKLQILSVSQTRISNRGVAELRGCKQLKSLNVLGTNCSLDATSKLIQESQSCDPDYAVNVVANSRLNASGQVVSLDLSGWRITDEDVSTIASLRELKWLIMPGNELSDQGFSELANSSMKTLTLLNVNHSGLTDQGLQSLGHLESLRDLHVADCNLSESSMQQLEQQHPRVRLYRTELKKASPP